MTELSSGKEREDLWIVNMSPMSLLLLPLSVSLKVTSTSLWSSASGNEPVNELFPCPEQMISMVKRNEKRCPCKRSIDRFADRQASASREKEKMRARSFFFRPSHRTDSWSFLLLYFVAHMGSQDIRSNCVTHARQKILCTLCMCVCLSV